MCEYCERKKQFYQHELIGCFSYIELKSQMPFPILVTTQEIYASDEIILSNNFFKVRYDAGLPISFCPWCGKKIGDVEFYCSHFINPEISKKYCILKDDTFMLKEPYVLKTVIHTIKNKTLYITCNSILGANEKYVITNKRVAFETSIPVNYCPQCGKELENV